MKLHAICICVSDSREGGREGLTDWLNFSYTRIEVKAQIPVEQPVLDKNYKHLKNNTNLAKNDDDKNEYNYSNHSSMYWCRGENFKKNAYEKKQTNKKQNRVVGGGGGEVIRVQNN